MKTSKKAETQDKSGWSPRNLIPGTLIYKGKEKQGFNIEILYYSENDITRHKFSSTASFLDFNSTHQNQIDNIKWINVNGLWNIDEINNIGTHLGISKLILEQILNISNHSINRIGRNYLYNSIQMVYLENNEIKNEYISIYKGSDFIVTFQEKPGDIFDDIRNRIQNDEGIIRKKSLNYLYFCLMDALGDSYLTVAEKLQQQIEFVEEIVIRGDRVKLNSIHGLRKVLMILGLSVEPVGKFIQKLIEDENILPMADISYLESLDIHMRDAVNEIKLQNNTVDQLFENYVLNNSNNMNQIMTILTIFSAIFIPLSFLAGVFGMNFDYLPGLSNRMGFFYFIIGCFVTAGGMLAFFKIKKWF